MDTCERYREYRAASQELMNEVLRRILRKSVLNRAAQSLGMTDGGDLRLNIAAGISVLFDFALHDIRNRGHTAIEEYRDTFEPQSPLDQELLDAHAVARTSLYRVIDPNESLFLRDLLQSGDDVHLTDVNLSQTARPGMLLFTRLVVTSELTISSGMTLGFSSTVETQLMDDYQRVNQKHDLTQDAARRFAHFFKAHQAYGLQTQHAQFGR